MSVVFDPQQWVVSLFRTLKDYVLDEIDGDVFEVVFEFPAANSAPELMPNEKALIHFSIDDIENRTFGFGHNVVKETIIEPAGGNPGTVQGHEAGCHYVNFDVGIWAADFSGGVTVRLQGYQALMSLFYGAAAFKKLRERGVEIVSYNGGRFITERINDVPIFRTIDSELVVRVYSERLLVPDGYVESIEQEPGLTIDGEIIVP
jgi:hypothetical protein